MSDIEAAFEEHFRYVYLYILKLSRDEALAEEITSESFLKALSSIDSFKGDCDIRVWLCQIAKNCYFTHRKKFQREYTLERPDISGSGIGGYCEFYQGTSKRLPRVPCGTEKFTRTG